MGRIMGPFQERPISNLHISPVGVVPKADGGWRMIMHRSYPKYESINYFIDPEVCSVHYSSFDNVVDMISSLGKGALLGKVDVKSAFRLIPVHPSDFELLGFSIDSLYYVDKCSISCKIWETFANFLQWLTQKRSGLETLDHYLDDFILAGKIGTNNCEKLMSEFDNICTELNIPLAEDKGLGPVSVLTYLGLEIPKPKVEILKQYVQEFLSRKSVLLKELESLVGMINFFGKAIRSSRAFNRRFYDAMSGASEAHHHIRLFSELKDDLHMWAIFLEKFNGISYFPSREWISSDVLELFTDSTGNAELGCGAYFQGRWAFFEWPPKWHSSDIIRDMTFLELVPLVLAIRLWGQDLECKKVLFFIDNYSALVSIVNKQTSKSKRVMKVVTELVLMLMQYNCIFKAKHIESSNNCIADSISRKQWGKFRQLAPEAKEQAEPIPQDFLQMIYSFK